MTGSDANPGTAAAPLRTIQRAVNIAPAGGTVVIHGGVYVEYILTPQRKVTIQNAPGERVYLEGSQKVTGWVQDGTAWRKDGWKTRFDSSPSYTPGGSDSTTPYWQFVSPSFPMASHPDQVFVDGYNFKQVGARSSLAPGKFYLDTATSKLYLGSDPNGHSVRASVLPQTLRINGPGTVVRGITIRRNAPSIWMGGGTVVDAKATGVTFENVIFHDSATAALSVQATGCTLRNVTIEHNGMLGLHAQFADGLRLDHVVIKTSNIERFNITPVAGGMKIGKTRGLVVVDSVFANNNAHGLWTDLSVYDITILRSRFTDNLGDGIFLEISSRALVAGNLVLRNGDQGMKINNTTNVRIWNNTVAGKGRPINLVQDSRRNTNPNDQAVDPRQPFPDPTMPWTLGPVQVRNNIIVNLPGTVATCVLCAEDYSFAKTAEQMGISYNGNVFGRSSTTAPKWLAVWSRGTIKNPYVFDNLAAYKTTTGQEARGREYTGATPIVDAAGTLSATVRSVESAVAVAVPTDVAAALGVPAGTVHLGHW